MTNHTRAGHDLTDLILETFRLNGRLLAAGDELGSDLGLTSARWQVLGAVRDAPLTVAQIGRNMGLTRQAVQRVANVLAEEGHVDFVSNPDHRRAKLVRLTGAGDAALTEISRRQVEWSNKLAKGMRAETIHEAFVVMQTLRHRLESDGH